VILRGLLLLIVMLSVVGPTLTDQALAEPAADRLAALRRGVNLTNWFRYPARTDPADIAGYLGDAAIADLARAGFGFVRLPVQPEFIAADPARLPLLGEAIARLQRHGLAVVVVPHPASWRLESSAPDRARLLAFWRAVGPLLARFDPRLTFPEVLNEPVFPGDPAGWAALQASALAIIRASLPAHTVILTGQDWGSVGGLLALAPVNDANVVYSVHFYDPAELTSLAAYRPGLDSVALARLPFPMDAPGCASAADAAADAPTRDLIRFVCARHWNAAMVRARFAEAGAWARRNRVAVLLGEFGASARLNAPARLAWIAAVRDAAEREGIGWALWGYDDAMGFGVPRPPGPRPLLDGGLLRALGLRDGSPPARSPP
jgi:endoglucanase